MKSKKFLKFKKTTNSVKGAKVSKENTNVISGVCSLFSLSVCSGKNEKKFNKK